MPSEMAEPPASFPTCTSGPSGPTWCSVFATFLADTAAANVDSLFILGDLFEYWIGDDDLADPFNADVCNLLRSTADMGVSLYFIAGNRDFLIGPRFAAAARMMLLDEATKVGAGGTAHPAAPRRYALHRRRCPTRSFAAWFAARIGSSAFLARPLSERRPEVEVLRRRSAEAMQAKTLGPSWMPMPMQFVPRCYCHGCQRLIHGHTHRPGQEAITCPRVRPSAGCSPTGIPVAAMRWKSVRPAFAASSCRFSRRPRARSACRSAGTPGRRPPQQAFPMPEAARASALMRPWVVLAGWVMVLLVSPRLAVIDIRRVASTTFQASSRPPLTSKETIAPPDFCWRIASACCGCEGRPG
jgi:UDP-2,3-diacylglucosamine hydrolase